MKSVPSITISLESIKENLQLYIDHRRADSLYDAEDSFIKNNEARYQLVEGCIYDYQLSDPDFILGDIGENIVQKHKRSPNLGTITPNIFVGTLSIPLLEKGSYQERCKIELEVQSIKSGYRDDYRDMLEFITEKCTDLLLQVNSPVSQHFETDYSKDSQSLYQRFIFIKSIIGSDEFQEAVHRIVSAPVTKWSETVEEKDIRNARRFTNANIKEILKGGKRTTVPPSHYLRGYGIETLPERITSIRKTDSVDTPENRFIKHALENFLKFCSDINKKAKEFKHTRLENESELLIRELENQLHHSVFKDISRPTTLNLNSPVLQRKEGYREILRVWLMFDLAAKLIWKGGDDVYSGGKKDIATLYEYWLFFKLLELLQSVFEIDHEDVKNLIGETADKLNVQIKQGKHTALKGIFNSGTRKLNIRFNYNHSFSGKKPYPQSGSWTTTLRPDYTLSVWPYGIGEAKAEEEELIVHIHFDAKYKVANFNDNFYEDNETDLNQEDLENRKGIYKNADLLKMHAYKDAIRRTGGAYVLYPGGKSVSRKGFHEIIPGLGAFPVKPSKSKDGTRELKSFILEVVEHFLNRTSQREKIALKTYDTYKYPPDKNNELRDVLPETYGTNRDLIPDETFVLVGFYKSQEHYDWIKKEKVYNFRTDRGAGSIRLDNEVVTARYLLLHTRDDQTSGELWKIKKEGPKIWSKQTMQDKNYPNTDPKDYYMIIEIEEVSEPELKGLRWDFKKLKNYKSTFASALPFTSNLSELMKNKIC
ncbi:MAG: DUF2357 domain-containing protein [Saprospiraceae bacterium]|nr:DUF2357 domain-containing protein [Saprospiraceae bacterium]